HALERRAQGVVRLRQQGPRGRAERAGGGERRREGGNSGSRQDAHHGGGGGDVSRGRSRVPHGRGRIERTVRGGRKREPGDPTKSRAPSSADEVEVLRR